MTGSLQLVANLLSHGFLALSEALDDRIVVMADGRIVFEVTHAELDGAEAVYRRLISAYRR